MAVHISVHSFSVLLPWGILILSGRRETQRKGLIMQRHRYLRPEYLIGVWGRRSTLHLAGGLTWSNYSSIRKGEWAEL